MVLIPKREFTSGISALARRNTSANVGTIPSSPGITVIPTAGVRGRRLRIVVFLLYLLILGSWSFGGIATPSPRDFVVFYQRLSRVVVATWRSGGFGRRLTLTRRGLICIPLPHLLLLLFLRGPPEGQPQSWRWLRRFRRCRAPNRDGMTPDSSFRCRRRIGWPRALYNRLRTHPLGSPHMLPSFLPCPLRDGSTAIYPPSSRSTAADRSCPSRATDARGTLHARPISHGDQILHLKWKNIPVAGPVHQLRDGRGRLLERLRAIFPRAPMLASEASRDLPSVPSAHPSKSQQGGNEKPSETPIISISRMLSSSVARVSRRTSIRAGSLNTS